MTDTTQGQGFGGGAPNQQQGQPGAIPDDTPQWGQSLGQDVSNAAGAASNAIGYQPGAETAVPAGPEMPSAGTPQQPSGLRALAPRIMSYISGKGAASQQQFEQFADKIDPHYQEDLNDVVPKVISAAHAEDPNLGAAMTQYARTRYDLHKAVGAKALNEGNDQLGAQELNSAFNYLPNGDKIIVAPGEKGNFRASVTTADDQHSEFDLDRDQLQSFVRSSKSLFDTNVVNPNIFKSLASSGAQQVRAPDAAQEQATYNKAHPENYPGNRAGQNPLSEKQGPNVAPQTGGGNIGEIAPGGEKQVFDSSGFNPAFRNQSGRTANDRGIHRNGQTSLPEDERTNGTAAGDHAFQEANPASWKSNGPGGGGTGYWARKANYPNPDNQTDEQFAASHPPVRQTSFGVTPENAGNVPSATFNPRTGASILGPSQNQRNAQQNIAQQNNQTRRDIAGQQIQSREGIAGQNNQTKLQIAADRAKDLANNTTNRVAAEQARTASGILRDTMKGEGKSLTDAVESMRAAGVDDRLISSLILRQNAPGVQPQGQQPQGKQGQQPQQAQPPTIVNPKTGQRMILKGGQWTPIQ
jgi:hypothetical protein